MHHTDTVCGVTHQALCLPSKELSHHDTLSVDGCCNMQLFVLRGYQRVTISNCSSSVIFVGAVATSVVMENCKRTTVVTSCEIFQVGRTEDCTLFLQTLLPVEIFGASHNLYLAPLNVAYKGAAEHQRACGLDFSTNDSQWATPQVLNKTATWSLLPPSQFYQLHIPSVLGFEEVTTESKQDILSAPRAYQEVLDAGVARAEHVRTVLADPGIERAERQKFAEDMEAQFMTWLVNSGWGRSVCDALR